MPNTWNSFSASNLQRPLLFSVLDHCRDGHLLTQEQELSHATYFSTHARAFCLDIQDNALSYWLRKVPFALSCSRTRGTIIGRDCRKRTREQLGRVVK